jgi:SPP1 family predicted phage head-tail adaptor
VNPGKLRHRITILQRPTARDGEWTPIKTIWASKEPLLGREYFAAEAAHSKVEIKFRSRFTPGIDNDMRIRHGDDDYEILSVIDVQGLKRELLIYVKLVK